MAIGERIRFIRNLRGMTQKYLGTAVGFPEKTADIRLAQYEAGTRTPKADLIEKLSEVLDVCPVALDVPDIDSYIGLMHTLFALEDIYGFKIDKLDDEVCIRLDKNRGSMSVSLFEDLSAWQKEAEKYRNGEITKDEYDAWRYTYPENNTAYVKVPKPNN
ncbi:MAG: helix-turn-helix transcriptional regulator [Clostridia bacterium]|nr:helix-turn-helix transcriptional regulator [Clostridia bacterium]